MIGLGRAVVPYIMDELEADRSPVWLWALRAITRSDPAHRARSGDEAVDAWLTWWSQRAYKVAP